MQYTLAFAQCEYTWFFFATQCIVQPADHATAPMHNVVLDKFLSGSKYTVIDKKLMPRPSTGDTGQIIDKMQHSALH